MTVPVMFRTKEPNVIVDWVDTTTGVGFKRFYPCTANSGGETYFLANQEIAADWNNLLSSSSRNFDLDVEKSCYLEGDAFFSTTTRMVTGTSTTCTGTITVEVCHVDSASNETSLGDAFSQVSEGGAGGDNHYKQCIKISVSGQAFKSGDKIRLKVSPSIVGNGAGQYIKFYHDPSGRIAVTERTGGATSDIAATSSIDLPFKVNIE